MRDVRALQPNEPVQVIRPVAPDRAERKSPPVAARILCDVEAELQRGKTRTVLGTGDGETQRLFEQQSLAYSSRELALNVSRSLESGALRAPTMSPPELVVRLCRGPRRPPVEPGDHRRVYLAADRLTGPAPPTGRSAVLSPPSYDGRFAPPTGFEPVPPP